MNPLTSSFLGYGEYTVLPVTVLSVLTFTSEYASGLIRTTFTAVPQRWAVLAAKAAVTGAAALITGELLAFACFLFTQAILSGRHRGLPCPIRARCGPCWPRAWSWPPAPW
jgi:ABC-2 type transport system permease protein